MSTDISESQELKQTEINKYDFKTETTAVFKARKGIDEEIVRQISEIKGEPEWMLEFRLEALKIFNSKPMPEWGGLQIGRIPVVGSTAVTVLGVGVREVRVAFTIEPTVGGAHR